MGILFIVQLGCGPVLIGGGGAKWGKGGYKDVTKQNGATYITIIGLPVYGGGGVKNV